MRLLALDIGDRRVGVAISDATGLLATPLTVIQRKSKREDFARIGRLVRERNAEGLVVGHPLNKDGSAGPQAQRVERYATALRSALQSEGLDMPIYFWDEWMSTQRAQAAMDAAGRKVKDRRMWVDAVAAAIILQDYLDERSGR